MMIRYNYLTVSPFHGQASDLEKLILLSVMGTWGWVGCGERRQESCNRHLWVS